jgi:hypothetical protein
MKKASSYLRIIMKKTISWDVASTDLLEVSVERIASIFRVEEQVKQPARSKRLMSIYSHPRR